MNDLWIEKKKTSTKVSNDRIDNIMNIAFKSGAVSGKVSGAGGGGFFLFFVNDKNRIKLKNKLSEFNGYIENFSLSKHGAESWVDE